MKRLTNFVLIGPLLIWLTFLALLSPKIAVRGFTGIGEFLVVALLVCYAPGIIPLLALGGLDELMSRYRLNVLLRILVCGALGFAVAYALFWYGAQAVGAQRDFAEYGLWLGLLGGFLRQRVRGCRAEPKRKRSGRERALTGFPCQAGLPPISARASPPRPNMVTSR